MILCQEGFYLREFEGGKRNSVRRGFRGRRRFLQGANKKSFTLNAMGIKVIPYAICIRYFFNGGRAGDGGESAPGDTLPAGKVLDEPGKILFVFLGGIRTCRIDKNTLGCYKLGGSG